MGGKGEMATAKHSSTQETIQRRRSSKGSLSSADRALTRRLSLGQSSDGTSVSGFSDGSYEDLQVRPTLAVSL
jgi:hypothetical protein